MGVRCTTPVVPCDIKYHAARPSVSTPPPPTPSSRISVASSTLGSVGSVGYESAPRCAPTPSTRDGRCPRPSPASPIDAGPRVYPNRVLTFRVPRKRVTSIVDAFALNSTEIAIPVPRTDLAELLDLEWCPRIDVFPAVDGNRLRE